MSWFWNLFNNKVDKSIQEEKNKRILDCIRLQGFNPVEIRKALIELNRIKVKQLARIDGVAAVTIYNTINGRRTNPKAMDLIARSLALTVDDLFPEKPKVPELHIGRFEREPQVCTPEAPNRQPAYRPIGAGRP